MRGRDDADIQAKLKPVVAEVHRRIGNYVMAEDNDTLEGVILSQLAAREGSLAVVETFTGGQIAARIAPLPGAESVFRRGVTARRLDEVYAAIGLDGTPPPEPPTAGLAEQVAQAARVQTGATHALAALVTIEDGEDRIDLGGTVCIAVATADETVSRQSRLAGGRDWVRLGAIEMGLDSLRRYLQGLSVREKNDFERVETT